MRSSRPFLFLAFLSLAFASAAAQQKTVNGIDETHLTALAGTVHPLAQAKYDRGQVETSFPTGRLFADISSAN